MKSFRPRGQQARDSNGWSDFRGQQRGNETHASTTAPEARLARKGNGQEAKLCFSGHAMMENRNGLLVDLRILEANGRAEREAALLMLADTSKVPLPETLGAYIERPEPCRPRRRGRLGRRSGTGTGTGTGTFSSPFFNGLLVLPAYDG